ncbi:riboflavin synthase [bacterium]|nr:riboflavin synthase [bacterium]
MFTGLIETIGTVVSVNNLANGKSFSFKCPELLDDLKADDSVAVNGICLTVTELTGQGFKAIAVGETLNMTNLNSMSAGSKVNLERALKLGDRLGGHLVQGHIDGTGVVLSIISSGTGYWLELQLPQKLHRYAIHKGSITLNGISLTIASIIDDYIKVAVIPYTWENTCLKLLKYGDKINIEMDMIGKYVEKMIGKTSESGLNFEKLKSLGY